jgi:hypothetical protein
MQVVAVAPPPDRIKEDPGTPGLTFACVYRRSRMGHAGVLLWLWTRPDYSLRRTEWQGAATAVWAPGYGARTEAWWSGST